MTAQHSTDKNKVIAFNAHLVPVKQKKLDNDQASYFLELLVIFSLVSIVILKQRKAQVFIANYVLFYSCSMVT